MNAICDLLNCADFNAALALALQTAGIGVSTITGPDAAGNLIHTAGDGTITLIPASAQSAGIGAGAPGGSPSTINPVLNDTLPAFYVDTSTAPATLHVWNGTSWSAVNPVATEAVIGLMRFATEAEVNAGVIHGAAVQPADMQWIVDAANVNTIKPITGNWNIGGNGTQDVSGVRNTTQGNLLTVAGNDNLLTGNTLDVTGSTNAVFGSGSDVVGSQNLITGFDQNVIGSGNVIGGSRITLAATSSSNIGSGNSISVTGSYNIFAVNNATIVGSANAVSGSSQDVAGSENGVVGSTNTILGGRNSVFGNGQNLTATSSIVGGTANTLVGIYSAIFGASHDVTSNNTLVSGSSNIVNSAANSIVVGFQNDLSGAPYSAFFGRSHVSTGSQYSLVGGNSNTVNSNYMLVGGLGNIVQGTQSSFISGWLNTMLAGSSYSGQIGRQHFSDSSNYNVQFGQACSVTGTSNAIQAGYEHAAVSVLAPAQFGWRTRVLSGHNRTFLFGGGTAIFESIAANRFDVLSTGGASFVTNNVTSSLAGGATGVNLPAGGSAWAAISRMDTKELSGEIGIDTLAKAVMGLRIEKWTRPDQKRTKVVEKEIDVPVYEEVEVPVQGLDEDGDMVDVLDGDGNPEMEAIRRPVRLTKKVKGKGKGKDKLVDAGPKTEKKVVREIVSTDEHSFMYGGFADEDQFGQLGLGSNPGEVIEIDNVAWVSMRVAQANLEAWQSLVDVAASGPTMKQLTAAILDAGKVVGVSPAAKKARK